MIKPEPYQDRFCLCYARVAYVHGMQGGRSNGGQMVAFSPDNGASGRPSFVRGRQFCVEERQRLLLRLLKQQASDSDQLIKLLAERCGGGFRRDISDNELHGVRLENGKYPTLIRHDRPLANFFCRPGHH